MAEPDQERVTCPGCGTGYRWQTSLAGREVPCKQCGNAFIVPDQPGPGLTIPSNEDDGPENDDGLYDLASDPDEDRELPPAYVVPKPETNDPPAVGETSQPNTTPPAEPDDLADTGEPQVHISEAAKAARREEQRIAAATIEPEPSWRKYKWLIILIALVGLALSLMWVLNRFAEFIDDPTPPLSMQNDCDQELLAADRTAPSDWL